MIDNRKSALFACMVFILLGFVVNGIAGIRGQSIKKSEPPVPETNAGGEIYSFNSVLNRNNRPVVEISENRGDTARDEKGFIIKLYNGNIAVFPADDPHTPIKITDIPEHTLRIYDRELLREGIRIKGEKNLSLVLEDYGS
ncbi:MAG: hypothetical protein GX541_00935 [Clostridiales bacterium]|nr:hypothetical protein [Clostridiales bacterium]